MILTRPIGIDLGTTNSAVAMLDPNERDLVLYKDAQGRPTTPSCIWLDPKSGEIVVGHRAYARKGTRPEPVSSIKRSMGTQLTAQLGTEQRSPAEISAHILGELKRQMEAELERRAVDGLRYDVSRAIVTVPAYFGLPAIEATREAGVLAGLEVAELLHEPTAAAIYYCWKHNLGDGVYLVYDLGGGTFDVSVLRRTAGEFLVLGISGDNFLGGDDFDRRLAEHLRQQLVADDYALDLDVENDPEDRLRFNQLMALAERAKKELSERDEIVVRDQGAIRDQTGAPVIVEAALSRATFEGLIDDLLERTLVLCQEALTRARQKGDVGLEDVGHILLVGGSTYVPAVAEKVRRALCRAGDDAAGPRAACVAPIRDEPETAVALGAALRAAGGLGVGDDTGRVRLWFRSAGATGRERATISGQIEPLQPDLALDGGLLRLSSASGDLLGEVELQPGLRFAFPTVPLEPDALNQFHFALWDSGGSLVANLGRSIVQATDHKELVGRTLSTAVLSKPIVLEGTDGDRLVRQVLLAEGTSLPARAQFTFAVADPGGRIRLPIYQENRIIKELRANVGAVKVGSPVGVDIAFDEQVKIQVEFSIGDQSFGGRIEPPPPDDVPTEHELEQTDASFRAALQPLETADARRLELAYQQARQDLDEARAGADYPKVIQRAADLVGLTREARQAAPLQPPLAVLEKNLASCLTLLPQSARIKPQVAAAAMQRDLEQIADKARQTYAQRDHQGYSDAVQVIETSLKFLSTVTRVKVADDKDVDDAVRAMMAVEQAREMAQFLLVNCLLNGQTGFFATVRGHLEELERLEKQTSADPVSVLNRCQVLMTEARRIFQQISPAEKTGADLDGLINVGAQRGYGQVGAADNLFDQR